MRSCLEIRREYHRAEAPVNGDDPYCTDALHDTGEMMDPRSHNIMLWSFLPSPFLSTEAHVGVFGSALD